jgi:hypothetical protein
LCAGVTTDISIKLDFYLDEIPLSAGRAFNPANSGLSRHPCTEVSSSNKYMLSAYQKTLYLPKIIIIAQ